MSYKWKKSHFSLFDLKKNPKRNKNRKKSPKNKKQKRKTNKKKSKQANSKKQTSKIKTNKNQQKKKKKKKNQNKTKQNKQASKQTPPARPTKQTIKQTRIYICEIDSKKFSIKINMSRVRGFLPDVELIDFNGMSTRLGIFYA